jgi:hypothetical protein
MPMGSNSKIPMTRDHVGDPFYPSHCPRFETLLWYVVLGFA